MKKYVIIVAGGKGLRMGSDLPKQFLPMGDKPVLMHTLEVFRRYDEALQIILVLPQEQQSFWKQLCDEHHFTVKHVLAEGGETRFHSVKNGLALVQEPGLVGVHDGVRPFVSVEVIRRCYELAEVQKAVIPVVDVVETLRHLTDSVVFQVVEEMPDFPGGVQALMDYLSKNVRYPAEAHAIGAQGRVIVSFTVKKDGSIADTKVERSVNPYLDKEAMRVIAAMPKWKPGKQRGEAVNVKFTVPVAFRLSGPELPKAEEVKQSDMDEVVVVGYAAKDDPTPEGGSVKGENEDEVFTMVEVMPKFPGGQAGLFQYLARSIKYPVIAQKSKEQGRVIIQMVISKDGSLSNIKVLRSVSPSLDAEAVRVVGNMPKWEPGMQKGQPVSVKYTIPIVFRLQ